MSFDTNRFAQYIETFNQEDWDYLGKEFFTDNIIFESPDITLKSREDVVEMFKRFHMGIRETLTIDRMVINENHIAAELTITFNASVDFPQFPVKPLISGEKLTNTWSAFYDLEDDKISRLALFYWLPKA